jgi:mono/diheme cytochrome c family protein
MLTSWFLFPLLLLLAPMQQQPAATPAPPAAIPAEAVHMLNPVKATPEGMARAKKIYGYDCAMCHGATGNGKGDMVTDLKLNLKDWTNPEALKNKTDGELYYIITNGQGQMPGETGRAKPEELWDMVVLVRSFSAH